MSLTAYVSRSYLTNFSQKDNMLRVFSEVCLFLRYRRDHKEMAVDTAIKYFMHHTEAPL